MKTDEVAACGGRMRFFFYCASFKRRQAALKFTFPHKIHRNSPLQEVTRPLPEKEKHLKHTASL
jgi:hypothetical protein